MKAGAELDQGGNSTLHLHRACRRLRNSGHQLERCAFSRSIAPDDAVRPASCHVERHALQRWKRFFRLQILYEAALQQRALQRRELLPPRVPAVDLRDVGDLDSVHTSSAYESRRRSKRKYANSNSSTEPAASATSHFQCPKSPGK